MVSSTIEELKRSDLDIEFTVEYMDTKRQAGLATTEQFKSLLRSKYRETQPDIVIVSDDNAYQFLLANHQQLFPELPVVFLGVNNFIKEQLRDHENMVTGLIQKTDIYETAVIALVQNPQASKLLFVQDGTPTGVGDENTFRKHLPEFQQQFPNIKVEYLSGKDHTTAEMLQRLGSLDRSWVVVLSLWTSGKDKELIPYLKSFKLLSDKSTAPIYSPAGPGIIHGIVGGKVTTGEPHGRIAAEMALKILEGTPVKEIPVMMESVNLYQFDYEQLRRWHVDMDMLPEDSIIVNKPTTVFEVYSHIIIPLLLSVFVQFILILLLSINIRKRKQAEKKTHALNTALETSEERLEFALAGANDGIWDWNLKDNIIEFDTRYYTMAGYEPDEFTKNPDEWEKRVHPDDLKMARNHIKDYLENKCDTFNAEFRFLRKDHSYTWVRGRGKVVSWGPDGNPIRFVGTHSDISALKQAKKKLEESEKEHRQLYQQSPVMMHNIDVEGCITEVNEAWLKTMGYFREEVIGRLSADFLTNSTREKAKKLFSELNEKKLLKDIEYQFVTKSGEVLDVLLTANIVKGPEETRLGTRAAIVDVTERNKMLNEKGKLVQQLHQAQKMEAIGTLAGGIAHDFNNILSSIFGFTELAKLRTADDNATQKSLGHVLVAAERAKELVQHLLAFSRKTDVKKNVLEIAQLIKETVKFIKATAPSTIQIRTNIANADSCLLADATQMHQVFMNLLTNAVHAMKDNGGILTVNVENITLYDGDTFKSKGLDPGDYLKIIISDTGYGISKEFVSKIFDPFFTTKGKGEGTGLGLSVTYGIIKEMKGHISVYSEKGMGTTFKVFLPEFSAGEIEHPRQTVKPIRKGEGTILLVDDEEDIIEWMSELLDQLGYTVIADSNPKNAFHVFNENPERFDLVLTDLTMPKMTGTDLIKAIRRVRSDLPVILCTGFSEGVTDEMLEKIGVSKLLMKPVISSELSIVIDTCLRNKRKEG